MSELIEYDDKFESDEPESEIDEEEMDNDTKGRLAFKKLFDSKGISIQETDPVLALGGVLKEFYEDLKEGFEQSFEQMLISQSKKINKEMSDNLVPFCKMVENLGKTILKENLEAVFQKVVSETKLVESFSSKVRFYFYWQLLLTGASILSAFLIIILLFAK